MKRIALYIATFLELNNVNGQSFNNGDLDGGPVTWINILPTKLNIHLYHYIQVQ